MKYLISFFSLIFSTSITQAQWTECKSLTGGSIITAIAEFNSKLYISVNGRGVFSSSDAGNSWEDEGVPFQPNFGELVQHNDNLLLIHFGKLFRTSATNPSWSQGPAPEAFINDGASDGTSIFLATHLGVFRSIDGGASWQESNDPNTKIPMKAIAIIGSTIWAGADAPNNGSVFRSNDNGTSWEKIMVGTGQISGIFESGSDLFINVLYDGIYKSSDNGQTWTRIRTTVGDTDLFVSANGLFFLDTYHLSRSTTNGNTWAENSKATPKFSVECIYATDNYVFLGSWSGGVLRNNLSGTDEWQAMNTNLNFVSTNEMLVLNNTIYLATERNFIRSSTDEGETWDQKKDAFNFTSGMVQTLTSSGTDIYFGNGGGGVRRSSDSGNTWTPKNTGLTSLFVSDLASTDAGIFASTDDGIFHSTNKGETWMKKSNGITAPIRQIKSFDNYLLVGTFNGLFMSDNNGESWNRINTGITNENISAIETINSTIFIAVPGGLYKSENLGNTWEPVNNKSVRSMSAYHNHLFIGTVNELYSSDDFGETWKFIGESLPGAAVTAIDFTNAYVMVGLYNHGIWRRPKAQFIPPQFTFFSVNSNSMFGLSQPIYLEADQELLTLDGDVIGTEDLQTSIFIKNSKDELVDFTATIDENKLITINLSQPEENEVYVITVEAFENSYGLLAGATSQPMTAISNFTPEVSDSTLSVEGNLQFDEEFFTNAFVDVDGGILEKILIASLPENGTLLLGSTAVNVGQEISMELIDELVYLPNEGYSGEDSFSWNGFDGKAYSETNAVVSFRISLITGISETNPDHQLKVYPNHASTFVNVDLKAGGNGPVEISIIDLNGKKINRSIFIDGSAPLQATFDVSDFPSGVYVLKVEFRDHQLSKRIIKY